MILDTSETTQEITSSVASTTEEVLIQAMDSFNNDDPSLLQRSVKADDSEQTCTNSSESTTLNNSNEITIKLKLMNDDQKLVTGSLKEMLGDFKRSIQDFYILLKLYLIML